ncbi:MAG TPA: helix-turn-helix transcriptional regulator, partial [Candidatus Dormibacteraeota bacterium]|nr:helix-turn-helix transcriptional regulator [Candidatus Dormibacteraeota bacterium]
MTAQSRAIDRIMRICATAAMDDRSLRVAILNEIRPVVAFDAFVWLLTDPQTEVGCSPLADVPCLPELPRLIMLKYLTPFNRWTRLKGPVARMHESSGRRLERSLVWSSLLSRYGVTDVASVVFRGRQGCWGFLDLWRINPSAPFTESEAGFLTSIAKGVTEALQGSQAGTFKLAPPTIHGAGPAVLILSPELEVRAQTAETNEYLRLLIPPDPERRPIPAAAYNVGAQLLAVEAGVDQHPPWARVHLSLGVWLTLRAARLEVPERAGTPDIAVTIEKSSPTERLDLFSRACSLSAREVELLGHLMLGADTHLTAQRMFVSENTVQDHLKSIFAKTATT